MEMYLSGHSGKMDRDPGSLQNLFSSPEVKL